MVRWTAEALGALVAIIDYIEAENPAAAFALGDRILTSTETILADHPHAGRPGRPGRVEGTRELVVHPSYLVAYRVKGDEVQILTVRHAARMWPSKF